VKKKFPSDETEAHSKGQSLGGRTVAPGWGKGSWRVCGFFNQQEKVWPTIEKGEGKFGSKNLKPPRPERLTQFIKKASQRGRDQASV